MSTQRLRAHPATPAPWVQALEVEWRLPPDGDLALRYRLQGDMARLRLPDSIPPARRDGLWRHTCLELFAAAAGWPGYREFNFSPGGAWQAYGFRDYRDGGPLEPAQTPEIHSACLAGELCVSVHLPRFCLPAGVPLRLGLSAVLETVDGELSYWALRHAPGRPDFHHPDTLALEIDLLNP